MTIEKTGSVRELRYEGRIAFTPSKELARTITEAIDPDGTDPESLELTTINAEFLRLSQVADGEMTSMRRKSQLLEDRLAHHALRLMSFVNLKAVMNEGAVEDVQLILRMETGLDDGWHGAATLPIGHTFTNKKLSGDEYRAATRKIKQFIAPEPTLLRRPTLPRTRVSENHQAFVYEPRYITRPVR